MSNGEAAEGKTIVWRDPGMPGAGTVTHGGPGSPDRNKSLKDAIQKILDSVAKGVPPGSGGSGAAPGISPGIVPSVAPVQVPDVRGGGGIGTGQGQGPGASAAGAPGTQFGRISTPEPVRSTPAGVPQVPFDFATSRGAKSATAYQIMSGLTSAVNAVISKQEQKQANKAKFYAETWFDAVDRGDQKKIQGLLDDEDFIKTMRKAGIDPRVGERAQAQQQKQQQKAQVKPKKPEPEQQGLHAALQERTAKQVQPTAGGGVGMPNTAPQGAPSLQTQQAQSVLQTQQLERQKQQFELQQAQQAALPPEQAQRASRIKTGQEIDVNVQAQIESNEKLRLSEEATRVELAKLQAGTRMDVAKLQTSSREGIAAKNRVERQFEATLRAGTAKEVAALRGVITAQLKNMPTSASKRMGEASTALRQHVSKIKDEIDFLDAQGALGPLAGRWDDLVTGKIGAEHPEFATLINEMTWFSSGALNAHFGRQGGQALYEHFRELFNQGGQSARNLGAAMDNADAWLSTYEEMGKGTLPGEGRTPVPGAEPSAPKTVKWSDLPK